MSGDADYPSVSLLLHCDGTDGSTTFTDSSPTPKTMTVVGQAHIETDQAKFGTASGQFDGTDALTTPADTSLNFGTGDFTIEAWLYPTADGTDADFIGHRYTSLTTSFWFLRRTPEKHIRFYNKYSNAVAWDITTSGDTVDKDEWTHVAAVRSGTSITVFIGGVARGSATSSVAMAFPNYPLLVGVGANDYTGGLVGYLDDIRITKGVARYTADFTPPAAAFPNYAGQIAGVITDDASDPVARVVRAYRRDTGALVGNTTSSAGDGSYSISLPTLDECSVIALDDASGDLFNDLIARVTPA